MLTYASLKKWMMDIQLYIECECDYIVLNSISNIKTALPYLQKYNVIHCYLDNDAAGAATMKKIKDEYSDKVIDESIRYRNFKDLNDVINGTVKKQQT